MATDAEKSAWQTRGFFERELPAAVIDAARADAVFTEQARSFGSEGKYEFPCGLDGLDMLPFALLDAAESLLLGPVLLSQADCWVKHAQSEVEGGAQSNQSQRMHADWGNNQLLPPTWASPTAVAALIYLDGPEDGLEGGGTAVVPRRGGDDPAYVRERLVEMPGYGGRPFFNNAEDAERWFCKHEPEIAQRRAKLYGREQYIAPQQGKALVYRLDLWHHGTPVISGRRRAYNVVFHAQSAAARSISGGRWNQGFFRDAYDWNGAGIYGASTTCSAVGLLWTLALRCWLSPLYYTGAPEALFCKLTPKERTALGFPAVGDRSHTAVQLRMIKMRLPDFDPAPYLQKRGESFAAL